MSMGVIRKTFTLLEALDAARGPVSLGELAQKFPYSKPTICRILRSLQKLGYVEQEGGRGWYTATARLATLGQKQPHSGIVKEALPLLQDLHREFDETVNLGVLRGRQVHYLHFLETTKPLRLIAAPNAVDEYYVTALGKAIAAFLPEERLKELLAGTRLRAFTPRTVRSKAALTAELDRVRAQGWAADREEANSGVVCFGVSLIEKGLPIAGVSLSLPAVRLNEKTEKAIVARLVAVAEDFRHKHAAG